MHAAFQSHSSRYWYSASLRVFVHYIHIDDGEVAGAGSALVKDVPSGTSVFGNPARIVFQKDI